MKKIILIMVFLLSVFYSCQKKHKPTTVTPVIPKQWEKYIGTYDVYDTINHTQWVMNIKFLSYANPATSDGNNDSVLLENFANKFDIRYKFGTYIDPNRIRLPFLFPLKDKLGNSWSFSGNGEDSTTPHLENYLANDSMVLYFKQSNIAFYANDGVPYYACDCKHIAVKRK